MITVVGEALVDLVVAADTAIAVTPGGAPFNVARACARLGAPVSLVAAISTDRFGNRLMADLSRRRGPHRARSSAPSGQPPWPWPSWTRPAWRRTGSTSRERAPARWRQHRCRQPRGPWLPGGWGSPSSRWQSAVERIVLDAGNDVLVLLDLNCRAGAVLDHDRYLARLRRVLPRADVVKASIEDLCYADPTNARLVAAGLIAGRTRIVLVTAGAGATTVVTAAGTRAVPVTASRVIDTIGAGDSFTAGFVTWWMASGRSVDDLANVEAIVPAVDAAHHVAAAVVGRTGADPPHRGELPPDWGPDVTRQAADRGSPSGRTHNGSRQ